MNDTFKKINYKCTPTYGLTVFSHGTKYRLYMISKLAKPMTASIVIRTFTLDPHKS